MRLGSSDALQVDVGADMQSGTDVADNNGPTRVCWATEAGNETSSGDTITVHPAFVGPGRQGTRLARVIQ